MRPVFVVQLLGEPPEGLLARLARRAAEDARDRAGRVGRAREQNLGGLVRGGDWVGTSLVRGGAWRVAGHSRVRMRAGPGRRQRGEAGMGSKMT